MNERNYDLPENPGTDGKNSSRDDLDLGEPIAELGELALPTSPEFDARVYARVNRRLIAADVVAAPAKIASSIVGRCVTDLVNAIQTLARRNGTPPD